MAETKREPVRMPSFDDLDDYEKELCQSADPADHTALLMRIALKGIGIDPDGDDWYVSGHKMESSDPNLVIEEQKLRYRPVVKKLHVLKPVTGRTFIQGNMRGALKLTKLMFPNLGSDERVIECDIHGWEEATKPDDDHNVYCSKCIDEQKRIAKSVRDDADTASMEELEAASDILDQADKMLSGLEDVDIAYEPIIESESIEDIEEIPCVPEYSAIFEEDDYADDE